MPRPVPCPGRRQVVATTLATLAAAIVAAPPASAVPPRALHRLIELTADAPAATRLATDAAPANVAMRARAHGCARRTPVRLIVSVDGRRVGGAHLHSARWRSLSFPEPIGAGAHAVQVAVSGAPGCAAATLDELRLAPAAQLPGTTALLTARAPLGPHRRIYLGVAAPWDLALRMNHDRDQAFLGHFDGLTPENAMKMTYVEPRRDQFDWAESDALVKYAMDEHRQVRGHTLIWNRQLPGWLTQRPWSRDEMTGVMRGWISAIVGHYRGKVVDWDVLNELFDEAGDWRTNSPWYAALGPDLAPLALQAAHDADPGARLFINDFDIERPGPKQDAVYDLVRSLKAKGVPIDGVGIQAHWSIGDIVPEGMLLQTLRRFASLGVRVELTELDITTDHAPDALQRQADAYAMAGRVCQSVPECDRVTVWGISDRDSWRGEANRPLLFDDHYAAKPAYTALRAALDAG